MALERFIPKSPDANIRNTQDFEVAKFGHLNTIVEYINNNSAKPAGLNGYVQFNNNNALGGDAGLFWDNTNKRFFVSGTVVNAAFYNIGQTYDPTNPANDFAFGPRTLRVAGNGLFIDNFDGASNTALSFGEGQATKMSFYYQPISGSPGLTMRNNHAGNTMMRWNRANNYLSINDYTSLAQLYIKGSGSTSATTSLLVQNSGGSNAFQVRDDNVVSSTISSLSFTSTVVTHSIGNLRILNQTISNAVATAITISSSSAIDLSAVGSNRYYMGYLSGGITGSFLNSPAFYFGTSVPTFKASAIVEMDSTTKGFLPPRMTTAQRTAISSPAAGLVVFDTTLQNLCYYRDGVWVQATFTAA